MNKRIDTQSSAVHTGLFNHDADDRVSRVYASVLAVLVLEFPFSPRPSGPFASSGEMS